MDLLFSTKQLRDSRWQTMSHAERLGHKRFSTGPQQIHPMYVEDQRDTPAGRDTGFGNTVYKTYFANLYGIRPLTDWELKAKIASLEARLAK